jgi:hypothetical protein
MGLASVALAQAANPQVGTWKINLAKSTYSPGPAPKSGTTKIEAAGQGVTLTVDGVDADGTVRHYTYTANYDGKDAKITGNNANADTVALTRVNPTTVQTINKRAGKTTTTQTSVVAADGKTRTVTTTGTDAQGRKVNNVSLYEKQ